VPESRNLPRQPILSLTCVPQHCSLHLLECCTLFLLLKRSQFVPEVGAVAVTVEPVVTQEAVLPVRADPVVEQAFVAQTQCLYPDHHHTSLRWSQATQVFTAVMSEQCNHKLAECLQQILSYSDKRLCLIRPVQGVPVQGVIINIA